MTFFFNLLFVVSFCFFSLSEGIFERYREKAEEEITKIIPDESQAIVDNNFMQWLDDQGVTYPLGKKKIELAHFKDMGRGLVATDEISEHEVLFRVPVKSAISKQTIIDEKSPVSELCKILDSAPLVDFVDKNGKKKIGLSLHSSLFGVDETKQILCIMFYLLHEKVMLVEPSIWQPWLEVLPTVADMKTFPLFWTQEENEELEGSPFKEKLDKLKNFLQRNYEYFSVLLQNKSFKKIFVHWIERDDFYWAYTTVLSRGIFTREKENSRLVLIPLLDMINHNGQATEATSISNQLSLKDDYYQFTAMQDTYPGDQVFVSYESEVGADELLLQYGFFEDDNKNTGFSILLEPLETDPIYSMKRAVFDRISYLQGKKYVSYQHISPRIYAATRILATEDIETFMDEAKINRLIQGKNIGVDLEIKVNKHLIHIFDKLFSEFPTSIEEDEEMLELSSQMGLSENQIIGIKLRMKEKEIAGSVLHLLHQAKKYLEAKKAKMDAKIEKKQKNLQKEQYEM